MATELHDLLLRQCRVLTREQAIAAGVSRHALAHRARPDGPWQRVLPAIFAAQTGPLTVEQRHIAALPYAGPASMLGGPSAAVTHGLRALRPDARVHLLVPRQRQQLSGGYVLARRTRRLPQPALVGRLRTAPLERAVIDACRPMCRLDEVRALVAEAVQRGLTSPRRLRADLLDGDRRATRLIATALDELDAGTRSAAEAWARREFARAGLPEPVWNCALVADNGQLLAYPDAYWEHAATVFEVDSVAHHLSPADKDRTERRPAQMTAHGILFIHASPARIRDDTGALMGELRSTLAIGALRGPAPGVRVRRPAQLDLQRRAG